MFERIEEIINNRDYIETCNPKNRDSKEVELFKEVLASKGKPWLIVALIEGSIGYHTPTHAKMIIKNILEGYPSYCERVMACYKSDLMRMVFLDILHLNRIQIGDKDSREFIKVSHMIENIDKLLSLNPIQQSTLSMLYPTS